MACVGKVQRKNGPPKWSAQVTLGIDPVTKRKRYRSKTFRTETEAKAWARKLEVDKADGVVGPMLSKLTFGAWLRDTWLPVHKTQVRSTYNVECALNKWIVRPQPNTPFLGSRRLDKLTVGDFNKLYAALAEHGMQYRGIEYLHGLLRRALKHGVEMGELRRNPTDSAVLPKPKVKAEVTCEADEDDAGEVKALTLEQARRVLAAAKDDRWCALWHLLLDSALRPGEAFALQWRHVDFERGVVKVRGTLKRVRGEARWMVTQPKTESSRDDVPLSPDTLKELRHWKAQQAAARLLVGPEWQDHGLVFTTEFGSPLGNNMGRAWERVLRGADGGRGDLGTWGPAPQKPKAGPTPARSFTPQFSMYVLRHTRLTLMYDDTKDIVAVSRFARHASTGITAKFYVHTKAENTKEAAVASFARLVASG